ncbi:RNA polymerase sigma factor [Streptomyces lavendulae]|uniref:RNA polymerase sigma factor n=1 Tax=Streptomyces lavendulae TaxID=1914 RepID=UPI00332102DF
MKSFTIRATPCLSCAAPVDLPDVRATAGTGTEDVPAYRDATRWCGRCMRYMDDWERFYLLYQPRVYRFCLSRLKGILPDNEDHVQAADDIAQETMITAHRRFRVWDKPERALWPTARRHVYARCATYRIVTKDGFPVTVRHTGTPADEDLAVTVTADPAEALIDRVVLHSALAGLPVGQRESLIAHKAFELPAAEAGRMLDRPPTTVKSQAKRGLEVLREAAAKGALFIFPAGAFGLYKALEQILYDTVVNGALDALTQPQVYTLALGAGLKYGYGYLRDRRATRRRHSGPDRGHDLNP